MYMGGVVHVLIVELDPGPTLPLSGAVAKMRSGVDLKFWVPMVSISRKLEFIN